MSELTLSELLVTPSIENWKAITAMGSRVLKDVSTDAPFTFMERVTEAVKHWPPEIERLCPASWPREFKDAVEHRVRETDTYGHYLAKICGHPDLKLPDGSQAVWLERRFTGGIVPVSTVQTALRLLGAALKSGDIGRVKQAIYVLSNGVRNIGKVGCADLTGGLTVEYDRRCARCQREQTCLQGCADTVPVRREYRLEVEVKVGKEEQRPEQVIRMNSVRARGGCYVLARSVEEAVAEIKRFRDTR
jgi:hypothetical protein